MSDPADRADRADPHEDVSRSSADRARQRFAALLSRDDAPIDTAEGALCIAAEHTELDVDDCLAQLAELADRAQPALAAVAELPLADRVDQLNQYLFREAGFRGCAQDDYYEPRNSFLNEVLAHRSGLPITLSIIYLDVARRLGLRASGIGFPGHFLCKVELALGDSASRYGEGAPIVVDPFAGRRVSEAECAERLKRAMGPDVELDSSWLQAASAREILFRLLGNLKQNYVAIKDWEAALACADRSLLVLPDSPLELRDRGILYQRLECFGPAADDLQRFLELAPEHESADAIRKSLEGLRAHKQTFH